jgi:DNA-binding transcriptional LysR family regulator
MADIAAQRLFASFPAYYRDFDGNFWEQFSKSAEYGARYYLVPPAWQRMVPSLVAARNMFEFRVFQGEIDLAIIPEESQTAPHYYMDRTDSGSFTYRLIGTEPEVAIAPPPALPDQYLDLAGRVWSLRGPNSDLYYAQITAGKLFDRIKSAGDAIANFAIRHCEISGTGKILQEITV